MDITADEVVKATAPIAEKLGIDIELWIDSEAGNEVQINGLYYRPLPAMAMILGLIVARSLTCTFTHPVTYGECTMRANAPGHKLAAALYVETCDTTAKDDILRVKFIGACTAFARAHGLEAAQ